MKQAFGTLATDENVCRYDSSGSNCYLPGLDVSVEGEGVSVDDDSWDCVVYNEGYSYCNE